MGSITKRHWLVRSIYIVPLVVLAGIGCQKKNPPPVQRAVTVTVTAFYPDNKPRSLRFSHLLKALKANPQAEVCIIDWSIQRSGGPGQQGNVGYNRRTKILQDKDVWSTRTFTKVWGNVSLKALSAVEASQAERVTKPPITDAALRKTDLNYVLKQHGAKIIKEIS